MGELDYEGGLDGMQADMAEHQRRHVGEVTASANQVLAAEAIARLERERSEAHPPVAATPAPVPPVEDKVERREVDGRGYTMSTTATDDVAVRPATEAEHWFITHAMPRVQLLLSKEDTGPLGQASWRQRVLAVMELRSRVPSLRLLGAHDIAADTERRFFHELIEVLDDSSRLFGEWKSDAPTKVMVG